MPDMMGGRLDMFIGSAASLMSQIKEGTMRAVGVFDRKRHAELPETPTIDELGYSGSEAVTWWGVVAPAGTPREIVDLLNREINAVLKKPEARAQIRKGGAEAHAGGSVDEFATLIQSDVPKWKAVIERANVKTR
jgi:tripartite-type tricarboxylate transporter receptor subunit TctC